MRHLAILLLLGGCATAPPPPPAPSPVVRVVTVQVPAPPVTSIPAAAMPVQAVLHSSAEAVAEAARYVAWPRSSPANIKILSTLAGQVTIDIRAMQASRRHGRYALERVRRAREDTAELLAYLRDKGD